MGKKENLLENKELSLIKLLKDENLSNCIFVLVNF